MRRTLAGVAGAVLAALTGAWLLWRRSLPPVRAEAVIVDPQQGTAIDRGAVRSVQAADLTLPEDELDRIWSPMNLERLARTYWRFLTRATLGLIQVRYTDRERFVVLLFRPFVLLSFRAPEYEMEGGRGIVRWRIEKGVLVSRRGRGGDGYLEIDVARRPADRPGYAVAHVEVEVANFYPALASGIATWFYVNTQSRIHVLVTHGFLRSLARGDLADSRVGRFVDSEGATGEDQAVPSPGETPNPLRERDKDQAALDSDRAAR
jgi:hypothetical protein